MKLSHQQVRSIGGVGASALQSQLALFSHASHKCNCSQLPHHQLHFTVGLSDDDREKGNREQSSHRQKINHPVKSI
jgi:hypothetical protein